MTRELIEKDAARRIISSPRSKEQMLRILENLPPVKAEPKHGEWVLNERGVYQCECGFIPTMEEKIYYNYCPNCGADMREVEE